MAVSQNPPSKPNTNTQNEEQEMENNKPDSSSPSKNTQSSGVEIQGKYCHQCRQRTMKFETCKNQRNKKTCPIKFCRKCLFNRYGEKTEEVALLDDWKCPKCRDICNCSCCMKRKGSQPTGPLVHTAKATGFSSVSEMLIAKGPQDLISLMAANDVSASPKNQSASSKELMVVSPRKVGKENSFRGNSEDDGKKIGVSKRKNISHNGSNVDRAQSTKTFKKSRNYEKKEEKIVGSNNIGILEIMNPKSSQIPNESAPNLIKKEYTIAEGNDDGLLEKTDLPTWVSDKIYSNCVVELMPSPGFHKFEKNDNTNTEVHIPLPQGIKLTTVVGIDLPCEDVGYALQFLEFCKAFGEVFNLKQGLPESVLRELTRGRLRCRGHNSSIVQFHFQLLSLMQKDSGAESLLSPSSENSWLRSLGKCLSESPWELEDFPLKVFDQGVDGYDKLDLSTKLKLLNFLCDEALSTPEIRSWIEKQNSDYVERKKAAKEKVVAAKDKEKCLKQKIKDEMENAVLKNGAPLSISEHDNLVSKMKIEAAEAHAEMLEAKNMASKNKVRSDAVRTESILLDGNGHAFWRLEGYSGEPHILLQDIGSWDSVTPQDRWFTYGSEQYKAVEDYISCKRNKKARK